MTEIDEIIKQLNEQNTITKQCADIWSLGNQGTEAEKATAKLIKILNKTPNWRIRSWIVWSLGRIGGKKAKKTLEKLLKKEEDEMILREVEWALDFLIAREENSSSTIPNALQNNQNKL